MFVEVPSFNIGDDCKFVTEGKLRYYSELLDRLIVVPDGFRTDFASIPRFFQRIIPVIDKHMLPAVVHDYLYGNKGLASGLKLTRKQCDNVFLEAMKTKGVSLWKRQAMHKALRIGGWTCW